MNESLERALETLTSPAAKRFYATVAILSVVAAILYGLVELAGLESAAIYVGVFFGGLGLLPGIWYVFGRKLPRGMRGVVAQITWTIAALIHGPYAVFWRDSGRIDIIRADPETDQIEVNGRWVDFDADGNWSRLGKQRAIVSYEKTPDAFEGAVVQQPADEAQPGGATYLGTRGERPIATRIASTAENVVIDLGRVASRWRGAAGGAIADAAKKDALIQYGGQVDISTRWLVIGILGSLALGTLSGWIMFGG